jgi:hypothetical protein
MKNNLRKIAFLALALAAAVSTAKLTAAHADGEVVGIVPPNPSWYLEIASNDLTNEPFFGQNTIQDYITSGDKCVLIIHPEFYPEPDEPDTALVSSAIVDFLVKNPNGSYEQCLHGGEAVVSRDYIQTITDTQVRYLQFKVGFQMFSEFLHQPIWYVDWEDAYFKIPSEQESEEAEIEEFVGGFGFN